MGGKDNHGYGRIRVGEKTRRVHCVTYEEFIGPTNGLCVCHKCDNPPCCNPEHLFLDVHVGNMRDMSEKMRFYSKHKDKVLSIIRLLKEGGYTQRGIAAKLGVSQATVSYVNTGKQWKHIER